MCGIIGYTGDQNATPFLLEGLSKLEYRGYDSAGIAVHSGNGISMCKIKGRISDLVEKTKHGELLSGHAGIGHTRWATHGAPTDKNAHPHMSRNSKFAVVHNGIIENYIELKKELTEKGYEFESDTDTEVSVHLLEMYYKGDIRNAIIKTVTRLRGSYAIGILCSDYDDTIFVAREASPLILGIGAGENYFASDITALLKHTREVIYLNDGDYAEISPKKISIFNASGKEKEIKPERVSWDVKSAEKGGYEHFMLKEIIEQPRACLSAISPRINEKNIKLDNIELSFEYLSSIKRILIIACGSAYYAGCAGRYAIEKLTGIPTSIELASEIRYSEPIIDSSTLTLVLSQSGETADTIAGMKECQHRGSKVLAIVNVVGSTIANIADYTFYTYAGPEIAVATTKGYTTQLVSLYIISLYIAEKLSRISAVDYQKYLDEISSLPKKMRNVLDMNPKISSLAERVSKQNSLFYIGRNTDYAAALEAALKMKEISYIHAEAYAAGELKHGTIALIDDGQIVIALSSNDKLIDKMINNITEVKSRGAQVIAVAYESNKKILTVADEIIKLPEMDSLFAPAVEIIPLQLLAYYVAKNLERDIDKPKNLAKSVTVE